MSKTGFKEIYDELYAVWEKTDFDSDDDKRNILKFLAFSGSQEAQLSLLGSYRYEDFSFEAISDIREKIEKCWKLWKAENVTEYTKGCIKYNLACCLWSINIYLDFVEGEFLEVDSSWDDFQ